VATPNEKHNFLFPFFLIVRRIDIKAIICDGRQGLFGLFGDIPMQMCQFHQIQIVQRYLTRKPKT